MAKYRYVYTAFWEDPDVLEKFTPEDKLFYLYLLTNPKTTQIGVYQITKKEMAFGLGYSIESINSLLCRFIEHHKLIKYDDDTREIAIKNWGKYNLNKGGKPIIDCINKEFQQINNIELVKYVAKNIKPGNIKNIYNEFIKSFDNKVHDTIHDTSTIGKGENNQNTFCDKSFDNAVSNDTYPIGTQKEKQKENKKQKENNTSKESTNLEDSNGQHEEKVDDDVFVKILDYYKTKANIVIEKPADTEFAIQLQKENMPLEIIESGIDTAFKSFKPKYEGEKIRSLRYCEGFIRIVWLNQQIKSSASNEEINAVKCMIRRKIECSDIEVNKVISSLYTDVGVEDKIKYLQDKLRVVDNYAKGKEVNYIGTLISAIKGDWKSQNYSKDSGYFNSFPQRNYDFNSLERKLLGYDCE